MRTARRERGFSLIEMGIVVVILALLLGGLLAPLAAQQDVQKSAETRRLLEEVREGLLGFAVPQGRLPCPDRLTDGDGLEDPRVDGVDPAEDGCAGGAYGGWVPWATLGVSPVDAWGRRLRYRVSRELTRRTGDPSAAACTATTSDNPCTLELGDEGNINVYARDLVTRAERMAASQVAAIVLSLGPNGLGGVDGTGASLPAPPAGAEDERRNLDLNATFSARDRTPAVPACRDSQPSAPPCEFDDLLLWVSPHILHNRLVSAGRLP
ncbi:MAG: prepilin-type N-terminal cleavage/methylation domain-containing protein [Gammaproteobacteria bacterium]|nr:prepilin-type N-terminal cleavage/methylation domain-containing protein [Gammaproteobacteria bacterium]